MYLLIKIAGQECKKSSDLKTKTVIIEIIIEKARLIILWWQAFPVVLIWSLQCFSYAWISAVEIVIISPYEKIHLTCLSAPTVNLLYQNAQRILYYNFNNVSANACVWLCSFYLHQKWRWSRSEAGVRNLVRERLEMIIVQCYCLCKE